MSSSSTITQLKPHSILGTGLLLVTLALCPACMDQQSAQNKYIPAPTPSKSPSASTAPRRPKVDPRMHEMLRVIEAYGLRDDAVIKAVARVPRHAFVPKEYQDLAYADTPLPIGYGQTISQPYIVAVMTSVLKLKKTSRVLEIGTGSGYQAAVLAEISDDVSTIEIVRPLAISARQTLNAQGYKKVKVRHADGYHGWSSKSRFDGIIVTCAAGQVPPPLLKQLAPGGRMIIPVGKRFGTQFLILIKKSPTGKVTSENLMAVRFVPLTRR